MDVNTTLLIAAALLPAVILCIYVFKKDRVEKEPIGLLVSLLVFGAVCCFPAAIAERFVISGIERLFVNSAQVATDGSLVLPEKIFYVYNFLKYFIGVALIEEAMKWFVLVQTTKKNRDFNSLFDGLIYAIFVSLGFAALENVFYVIEYGFMNALMRAILSVPGHMFFAVMMGYQYSVWHITDKAGAMEKSLISRGVLSGSAAPFNSKRSVVLSLLVPVIAHGIYDYCCTLGTDAATLVFFAFILFMYIYCFRKIKKMSAADAPSQNYAAALLVKKYPHLAEEIRAELLRFGG